MGKEFLHDLNIHGAGQIQFKTTAGSNAGKIDQSGNDLVLSNSVGDIIIGNGSDDVFIGDGTNTVDIRFEQNMAIFADSSSTRTLTLGGANTSLVLESPTISGSLTLPATTINNKLTFTSANGYIVFDYEPSGDTGAYEGTTSVPLLKVDRSGNEMTILERVSEYGALLLGNDDSVIIAGGDTRNTLRNNINENDETVIVSAEGGMKVIGFPNNLSGGWSARQEFRFYTGGTDASSNGLWIGSGGNTQFIDLNRNLKNIGTISNTGDVTITNGNIIFSSQYGLRFNDANTRIYTNTDSPEDLIIEADQDLLLNPDGQVSITGNLSLTADISTPGQINLPGDGTTSSFETLIYAHGSRGKLMKQGNAVFWQVAHGGNQFEITDCANDNNAKGNVLLRASGLDADDNKLMLVPDGGNVVVSGNITLDSNSKVISARKFTARDGNGVMLTADDATSGLSIGDDGNAVFTGSVTADTMVINDIDSTRGIFRNNTAYDLRLGGGTVYTDGAYISLSGGTRGGGTSSSKGRVEIFSGGSNFSAQADITGDILIGAQWNGGTSNILVLDSSSNSATFAGDILVNTATSGRYIQIDHSDDSLKLADGNRIKIGTGNDLQLVHDGSNSFIQDVGTGNLFIEAVSSIQFRKYNTAEFMAKFINDGAVELYYDNSKKFETTSSGASITGDLTVSGNLNITGDIDSYNVNNLDVVDKLITVGKGQTEANSNGSGILVDGSNASLLWDESNNTWDFNKSLDVVGNIHASGTLTIDGNSALGNATSDTLTISGSTILNKKAASGTNISIAQLKTADGSTTWNIGGSNTTYNDFMIWAPDKGAGNYFQINKTSGQVKIGADTSGSDLIVYGNDTGERMFWDASESNLTINHDTDDSGLEIYTVGSAQPTTHQVKIGRDNGQYLGIRVDDGRSYFVHRQDESGGGDNHHQSNQIWTDGGGTHTWNWDIANSSGGSPSNKMQLNSSGALSLAGSITAGGQITSGRLNITDAGVPIKFTESGNTGTGKYWRQVLDAGDIRFDVDTTSTNGDGSFSSYNALIQLNADGHTDINGALDVAGNIDANGNLDVAGNIVVAGTVDGVDIQTLNTTASAALPKAGGTMTGDLTIPNKIIHSGDTNTYMQFEANDVWRVVTDGTERLDINTNRILVGDDMNMQYDGISTGNSGTVVYGGFLNPASEANMVHIPHIINDLAGFNKWSNATITTSGFYGTRSGSSGSYTYSNEIANDNSGWANAFDAHSSTAGSWYSDNGSDGIYQHGTDTPGVVELEWTNEATYSLWAGIVFGSGSFTATYVKIEAYRAGAWQTLCEITDNTDQVILRQVNGNSGTNAATRRLRYTLGGSVNNSYFRIHSLYMANYRAGDNNLNNTGTDTTRGVNFLERYKDGYLHGHLRPGKDDTYDFGSSSYKWKNAYFDGVVYSDRVQSEGAFPQYNIIDAPNGGGSSRTMQLGMSGSTLYFKKSDATGSVIFRNTNNTNLMTIGLADTGQVTVLNELEAGSLDINGNADISGTSTFGGNVEIGANNLNFADNGKARFGNSTDLQIYHDGSNSYVQNTGTGDLILKGNTNVKVNGDGTGTVLFQVDAAGDIGLKVDTGNAHYLFGDSFAMGTGNFLEQSGGDSFDFKLFDSGTVTTHFQINPAGNFTRHRDNVQARFGNDDDLQIMVTSVGPSSNSFINNDTGDLTIRNTANDKDIILQSDNGSGGTTTYVRADGSTGAVQLYHYGSNKFATTAAGISVTGDISVSGDIKGRSVPMVIHGSFDDTTSSTSNLIIPLAGSITETTVSGGYAPHFFTIPYACVLKRVIMKTVAGSMSSSFTTELKAYKNATVTGNSSSGELTHSNSSVTWNPTAHNDITYAAGDKFSLVYQKSATSKYWQDVAITIVFTLTNYDI